jgi:hypothetical protein
MKIYTGGLPNKNPVDGQWLGDVLLLYPQIKKQLVKKYCDDKTLCFLRDLIGLDASINETEFQNRLKSGQMGLSGDNISWAVQTKVRPALTITTLPPIGSSIALNSTFTIAFAEDWLSPGMVVTINDSVNGGQINLLIMTAATGAGPYSYTAKVIATAAVTIPAGIVGIGDSLPWTWAATSTCTESCVKASVVAPDWYKNYTTHICISRQVCKTGVMNSTWIEGANGSMCFHSTEDLQVFDLFLGTMEAAVYYGRTNKNSAGASVITGPDGTLTTGDGIEAQIEGGNVTNFSVATYTNPTNYAAFLDLIEVTIEEWAAERNMASTELFARCGPAAFSLLQKVLEKKAFTAGGCCTLHDFKSGEAYDYALGMNILQYHFAGNILNLEKCMLFGNTSFQHVRSGSVIPNESYKFLIHPKTTCDGKPLYEIYFREGCGTSSAFTYKYVPGKMDPKDPTSPKAANLYDGYTAAYDTEFVVIVNEPSSMLLFRPIA